MVNRWLTVTLIACFAVLAYCSPGCAECPYYTPLTLGEPVPGELFFQGDERCYAVTVGAGEHLSVFLYKDSGWYGSLYLRYGQLPTTGEYDARSYTVSGGQAVDIPVTQAGTYYIMVRGDYGYGSYEMVAQTDTTWAALPLDTSEARSLGFVYDAEWYRVEVGAGEHLSVFLYKDSAWYGSLYVRHGQLPATGEYDARSYTVSGGQAVDIPVTQAGTYYIMVRGDYGYGSYEMVAQTDTTWAALPLDAPEAGGLGFQDDTEWYRVEVGAGERLSVFLYKDTNWYGSLYLRYGELPTTGEYDARSYNVQGSQAVGIPVTQPGTYYIMVRGYITYGSYEIEAASGTSACSSLSLGGVQAVSAIGGIPQCYELDLPSGLPELFVTLQKHDGWGSTLTLYAGESILGQTSGHSDLLLHVPSLPPEAYQIIVSGSGSGVLTADEALPELAPGVPQVGAILRQGGTAWYQVDVPPATAELCVAVETIGTWSQLKVYSDTIGGALVGSDSGPSMELCLPSPAEGMHYLHLTDSAWIQAESQERDHLIEVDFAPLVLPCDQILVTSVTPTAGGTASPVTVTVKGKCFDPGATACLTRDGYADICSDLVAVSDDGRTLSATFDLSSAEPGEWTLLVTNPDLQQAAAPTPFLIESGGEPDLHVELLGREQVRIGTTQTYIARISNSGNVDAILNFVWLQHDPSCELLEIRGADGQVIWPEPVASPGVRVPSDVQPPSAVGSGSTAGASEVLETVVVIPFIPAQSSRQLELRIRASSPGLEPWPSSPVDLNRISVSVGTYSLAFLTGVVDAPGSLAAILNRKTLEYGGQLRNYYEFESVILDGLADFWAGWYSNPIEKLCDKFISEVGTRSIAVAREEADLLAATDPDEAQRLYDLASDYEVAKHAMETAKAGLPQAILNNLKAQWPNLIKLLQAYGLIPVTSVSPEDKFGPSGWDAPGTPADERQHWIPAGRPVDYRIDFWNKEDAPAATLDVVITDQLDPNLDWSTLKFTEVGFLDWRVELEPCDYFNVDIGSVTIDLSPYYPGAPSVNLVVNVEGSFDAETGEIEWRFHAMDALTRDYPDDPRAGFLPPITDTGWEIGWVEFTVAPQAGRPSGTQLANQAWVKFDVDDFKPAPKEGPFINTLDAVAPTSAVQPLPAEQRWPLFWVSWDASDDPEGSGLGGYQLYASEDGGAPYLWRSIDTPTTTAAVFRGRYNHTYSFYVRARDHAGNLEAPPTEPDAATVTGTGFGDIEEGFWAFNEIYALALAGITEGYEDGTYRPTISVGRDQMAVYVARTLAGGEDNVPSGPATPSFTDVASGYWAYNHIEYCHAQHVVEGYEDQTYRSNIVVNRGQMAVYMARAMVAPAGDLGVPDPVEPPAPHFPDVNGTNDWSWCYKHVEYCYDHGVVGGYEDGTYRPHVPVKRDQMAVYVQRAFQLPM